MVISSAQVSPAAFDRLYGLEVLESEDGRAVAKVAVRDELTQGLGRVHGGIYAAIAETLASIATARIVVPQGKTAAALSSQTSFLRAITAGSINALARLKHRGRTTWVWEIEMSDDQARLCVLTRITVAVRDLQPD